MRVRSALALALVTTLVFVVPAFSSSVIASSKHLFAQDEQPDEEQVGGEEEQSGGGAEAETGAGEDGAAAEVEAGPLWTYQMARIALVGLVPLFALMGLLYYRLVIRRARGEA